MGMEFGGQSGDCPITEDVSDRLLRLPFHYDLTTANQATVVAAVKGFYENLPLGKLSCLEVA